MGRGRAGGLRRALLVVLDTRRRWWLSAWLWVALAAIVLVATSPAVFWLDSWLSVSKGPGFLVYQNGDRLVPARSGSYSTAQWWVDVDLHYTIARRRAEVLSSFSAVQMPSRVPETRPEYVAQLKELALERMTEDPGPSEDERFDDWPEARSLMHTAWERQIRTGSTAPVEIPGPLRYRLCWIAVRAVRALAWVLAVASLVHAFVRRSQLAAYRRMLHRHEAGRCPHCNYDISAAPDRLCPECGSDHRAIRQEAIDALRRAGRWPLEGPVPGRPG